MSVIIKGSSDGHMPRLGRQVPASKSQWQCDYFRISTTAGIVNAFDTSGFRQYDYFILIKLFFLLFTFTRPYFISDIFMLLFNGILCLVLRCPY